MFQPLSKTMFNFYTAKALAELARKHSVDVRFDSPYSMEARSRVRYKHETSLMILFCMSFFTSSMMEHVGTADMQGFDVPWWKKLLGAKLIGMHKLFTRWHALYYIQQ